MMIVAMLAAVATAAPGAGAHEFSATAMGKLTIKTTASATFTTNAGRFECSGQHATEGEAALSSASEILTIQYTGCTLLGLPLTISPAKWSFSAEGDVSLLRDVSLKTTGCEMVWSSAGSQSLKTVKYAMVTGKAVQVTLGISGLTSSGSGSFCNYASESNGLYSGSFSMALASGVGSVEWK